MLFGALALATASAAAARPGAASWLGLGLGLGKSKPGMPKAGMAWVPGPPSRLIGWPEPGAA